MARAEPVVSVRGLGKFFGQGVTRVDALADVDLDVYAGTVVGLLGPVVTHDDKIFSRLDSMVHLRDGRLAAS